MSSYRDGLPTGYVRTRLSGELLLGGRGAVAAYTSRHVNTVRRYCVPVACDVSTRADLYDLDLCVGQLGVRQDLCCILDETGTPCGSTVMRNAPVSVCTFHAGSISEFYSKADKLELARAALMAHQAEAPPRLPDGAPRASVVYYVQLGAVVKIGTTLDLAQRLQSYPPMARLLATEPGGYTLERKRHRQFNEYLAAGNEWFDPGPRLRAHIERLMARDAPSLSA